MKSDAHQSHLQRSQSKHKGDCISPPDASAPNLKKSNSSLNSKASAKSATSISTDGTVEGSTLDQDKLDVSNDSLAMTDGESGGEEGSMEEGDRSEDDERGAKHRGRSADPATPRTDPAT